ncbi:hypothetical protein [Paraburkholderia haematera]|jgi:hypothetical protein|uniref:Uncharacterized protein n=1 Tax=Paraburkholderia haematera TaxID=2793077 RepID=A0ABN7KHA1_9BURK|nr:hypothetical protein [Paraburkholderia haematera]CAE6693134.1 hypothetical protein R69888_00334 [Paraburkholderia haematera]
MEGTICSEGEHSVHVIVDRDTINDSQIEARAAVELDATGH